MSISASPTRQHPALVGGSGPLIAAVATLGMILVFVIALSQGGAAQVPAAGASLNYDAAIVAAAEARTQGEARQQRLANYDAAIVAAAEARTRGEAKQAQGSVQHSGSRATPE